MRAVQPNVSWGKPHATWSLTYVLPPSEAIHDLLIRSVVDYAIFMLDPRGVS